MKNDKLIMISGTKVPVSKIRHWSWNKDADQPSASSENEARWEAFTAVFRAWRDLDPAAFREHIADDGFEYGSYWVRDPMLGKKAYLDYITAKFTTIKTKGTAPSLAVVVIREALTPQTYCYAILFRQGDASSILQFTFKGTKISQMYMSDPDLFTYEPYVVGVLDGNGEPRMFRHSPDSPARAGQVMTKDELVSFLTTIAATVFKEAGGNIVSVNHRDVPEYPNLVVAQGAVRLFLKIDPFLPPSDRGSATPADFPGLAKVAADADAVPMILPVGVFCMDTNGEKPICGATFAAKIMPPVYFS